MHAMLRPVVTSMVHRGSTRSRANFKNHTTESKFLGIPAIIWKEVAVGAPKSSPFLSRCGRNIAAVGSLRRKKCNCTARREIEGESNIAGRERGEREREREARSKRGSREDRPLADWP